jgi:hypothetical protein
MRVSPRDFKNLGISPGLACTSAACSAYRVKAGEHNRYARNNAHGPETQVYRADGGSVKARKSKGLGNREQGIENGLKNG